MFEKSDSHSQYSYNDPDEYNEEKYLDYLNQIKEAEKTKNTLLIADAQKNATAEAKRLLEEDTEYAKDYNKRDRSAEAISKKKKN